MIVKGSGAGGDKELEGPYLKWFYEARVGSYATRYAKSNQHLSSY